MKIGIFTETYKPILNGVVTSVTNYTEGFRKLGHEVTVFCPTYKEKPEKGVFYVNSEPFPGASGYQYIMPFNKEVINIAKKLDIIHAHHPFEMGVKARRLAKKYKKPFVFTNHTQYEKYLHYVPVLGPLFKEGLTWWLQDFAKKCTLVTTPSQGMKRKLISAGFPKKTTLAVTNGVELEKFNKVVSENEKIKIRKEIGAEKDDFILVFTGRIAEEKNLSFLIKAFKKIKQKIPNSKLLLVGSGSGEKEYKKLIKELGIEKSVLMAGAKEHDQMYKYYQSSNLFAFASTSETQGLVTIEAMASGLPAIAVKATGTEDIVQNNINGFMVREDIGLFAQKTIEMIKNQTEFEKLAKNAPKSVEKVSILNASKEMIGAYKLAISLSKKQYK
jgi:glycosyltransferase involved in cell wall biosynthesis